MNAVRAFLCFFEKLDELECVVSPSSSEIFNIFRYSKNIFKLKNIIYELQIHGYFD